MNANSRDDVIELQQMLRLLARDNDAIPIIAVDGIYEKETENAVIAFQLQNGLEPNGVIDFATWTAVTEAYNEKIALSQVSGLFIFPYASYVTEPGEKSDTVKFIQLVISAIEVAYDIFDGSPISGVYDEKTMESVRRFQKINKLPETGLVDRKTWNSLSKSYNIYANHSGYTAVQPPSKS